MKIDKKIIKELSDYLDEFNLTELEYTEKDTKIKVSKNNISINNQNIPNSKSNLTEEINIKEYFESLRPKNADYLKLILELANLKVLKNTNVKFVSKNLFTKAA